VPLGAVLVLSWCGEVSLGGILIIGVFVLETGVSVLKTGLCRGCLAEKVAGHRSRRTNRRRDLGRRA